MIIYKALYGLRSSGREFGDLLADCLRKEGFVPSLAEPQIFMREREGLWEYIATYVDDLLIVSKDPQGIIEMLQGAHTTLSSRDQGPSVFT